jgi:hypothetical protein
MRLIMEEGYRNLLGRKDTNWPDKWILHHDNAPAHDALRVREVLSKKSYKNGPSALFS